MACNCNCAACPNLVKVTAIATANGVTTLTVPATFTPTPLNCYCFLVRVPIPQASTCNSIVVTDGKTTWNVLQNNGNNWRPCTLKCRTILKMRYLDDPAHFVIKQVKR